MRKLRQPMRCWHLQFLLVLVCSPVLAQSNPEPTSADAANAFRRDVSPVLQASCVKCHGPDKQEADLRIDTLDPDIVHGRDAETWHDILNKLNLGEMPPEDAPQLSQEQHQAVVGWLTAELQRAVDVKQSSGGQVVLRRLTRYEYDYTMRDLLGVDLDFAEGLPPESVSKDGFQNDGATLGISPLQIELYLESARKGLARAIVTTDEPEVFRNRVTESAKVRRVKGEVSNQLDYKQRFLMRLDEFPREGEVIVRVSASATAADDQPYPRMCVTMGVRADTRAPEKVLAVVDVVPGEEPQTFEFRGRIEDFPLPGHNPKFPGLQVTISNLPPENVDPKNKSKDTAQPLIEVHEVEFEGPVFESWPPPSHQNLLLSAEDFADETARAEAVLHKFLTRAYRRPAEAAEVERLMTFYQSLRTEVSFELAMREVLATALISPEFLYLVEPKSSEKREALSDYELASRLSYFLWCSMPDEQLFAAAGRKELHKPEVLKAEVSRMLKDPRSERLVQHLADQWFRLDAVDRIAVNPEYHPDFDDHLKSDMQAETRLLLGEILKQDLSCESLINADFTYLNHRLASHYGLAGPRGSVLQWVKLSEEDGNQRGGILTHGSVLLAGSNGEDSHPIKRAVWLLDRLLDNPPPPPPPDVPDLDADQAKTAGLTLKQQLEAHRKKEACNSCHRGIDPWGIAFENYDAVGRWRDEIVSPKGKKSRQPVDATAQLPDGTEITGLNDLKKHLLTQNREQFATATTNRLFAYALGRTLDISDQPEVAKLSKQFLQDEMRLQSLIHAIVQTEAFQTK